MSEAEIVRPFEDLEDAPHPSESQSCDGCLFYKSISVSGRGMGQCRRYPPSVPSAASVNSPAHANVMGDDWCGEWSDKNRKLFRWAEDGSRQPPWPAAMDRYRK